MAHLGPRSAESRQRSTVKFVATAGAIIANPKCEALRNKQRDVIKSSSRLSLSLSLLLTPALVFRFYLFIFPFPSFSSPARDLMQIQMARSLYRDMTANSETGDLVVSRRPLNRTPSTNNSADGPLCFVKALKR